MQATEKGVEFGLNARAHARDHHGRQARQGELAIAGESPRPKTYLLGQRGLEQKVSELGQQRLVVEYSSSYCLFINDLTNAILPVSHRVHKGYKLKLRALGLAAWNREQDERNYQAQLQRQLKRAVPTFHNGNASLVLEFLNLKEQTGETLFKVFELMVGDADNERVKKRFLTSFRVSEEKFRQFSDAVHNRTVSGDWARHATMRQPKSDQPMSKADAEAFIRRLADEWLESLM